MKTAQIGIHTCQPGELDYNKALMQFATGAVQSHLPE